MDDHSRTTWNFLSKDILEYPFVVVSFYHVVKTIFGVPLKELQSDNALEYCFSTIFEFCHLHAIIHQTTCVDIY